MKGKHRNNIESRLERYIQRDDEGFFYIPICNYVKHLGIIKDETCCIERSCNNYERYYFKSQDALLREIYYERGLKQK